MPRTPVKPIPEGMHTLTPHLVCHDAGAKVKMPVTDMFWGDLYGVLEDSLGHAWSVATRVRELTLEQIVSAMHAQHGSTPPEGR